MARLVTRSTRVSLQRWMLQLVKIRLIMSRTRVRYSSFNEDRMLLTFFFSIGYRLGVFGSAMATQYVDAIF